MVAINYRNLQRQLELDGMRQTTEFIREGLREKYFKPQDFSIRRLAEATIPDGREFVRLLDPREQQGSSIMEAAGGAVTTAAFSNITGQIVYSMILQAYEDPTFIGPQLVRTIPTQFSGEKIPGITRMGDDAENVSEGDEFPLVGIGQEYIETPETVKDGMIVPVTKEAIFFDRTNLVLERAREVGYWAGVKKEKQCVKIATGVTNSYKRNGSTSDTYKSSGGHGIVNVITDPLADWTDLEAAYLKFDNMTDFTTSEPILIRPSILLVPTALLATAHYILSSTQTRGGTSNTTAFQTISTDPIKNMMPLTIVSSQMVKAVTSQTNDWWVGDPQRAFAYMENWGITQEIAPNNSEWSFTRDIVQRFKVSWRGVTAVLDPHYMVKSTGGS